MIGNLRRGVGGGSSRVHLLLLAISVLGFAKCSKLNPKRDTSEEVVVKVGEDVCVDNCTSMLMRLQVKFWQCLFYPQNPFSLKDKKKLCYLKEISLPHFCVVSFIKLSADILLQIIVFCGRKASNDLNGDEKYLSLFSLSVS